MRPRLAPCTTPNLVARARTRKCYPHLFSLLSSPIMKEVASVPRAEKTSARRSLLFEDIPLWMQVDPRIRRGYREELKSFGACILSLFYVHNEFVNIWSHFLPAIVHLSLLVRGSVVTFEENGKQTSGMDTAMVQLYIWSAILCLLSSVCVPSTGTYFSNSD